MAVLYIGAGKDIKIINYCNEIYNTFIFVDIQRNDLKHEMDQNHFKHVGSSDIFDYYKQFSKFKCQGYQISKGYQGYQEKEKRNKKIYYYNNISLPLCNHKIMNKMKHIKLIIVKGYDPDCSILKNVHEIDFLGHYETNYHQDNIKNENSIINQLHSNKFFRNKFRTFYYLTIKNELKQFPRWHQFYNYYLLYH